MIVVVKWCSVYRQAGGESVMTVPGGKKKKRKVTVVRAASFHALKCDTVKLSERQKVAGRKMLHFSLRGNHNGKNKEWGVQSEPGR